jgi:hypothetical protein
MKSCKFFSTGFTADAYLKSVRESVRNREISPDCPMNSRPRSIFLSTAIFMLGKAVPAIHRTIFPGFKRNFALLFTVCTDGLMHLSRTSVISSILKSHDLFLHVIDIFTDIDYRPCKYDNHLIAYSRSFRLKANGFFLGSGPRLLSRWRRS